MDDFKLQELLLNLKKNQISAIQLEKNNHKWISLLLQRIHGRFMDDFEVVKAIQIILAKVVQNNQTQMVAPQVLSWMNDILSRITLAANSNTYMSIMCLFLR
jgi:organic radical activating enzyme